MSIANKILSVLWGYAQTKTKGHSFWFENERDEIKPLVEFMFHRQLGYLIWVLDSS